MTSVVFRQIVLGVAGWLALSLIPAWGQEAVELPKATIDGTGLGWRELGEADFVNVNTDPDTWTWKDGVVHCIENGPRVAVIPLNGGAGPGHSDGCIGLPLE